MNFRLLGLIAALCASILFTSCEEKCTFDCKNDGTCIDGTCECAEGFTGVDCSTQLSTDCPTDCLNDGICVDGSCNCPQGWEGDDCGTRTSTIITGAALRITGATTLTADNIYQIEGRLTVENGGVLTIEPGTILKFAEGQEASASALLVARGGTINAVGTVEKPIILTSILDNIDLGEITGTSLNKDDIQKWGGLIILGNAKISAGDGDTEANIEGLPVGADSVYGGDDDSDNSGTIQYLSVRHGGINIGEGNEINGITLGGVGNGTTIDHVEVVANFDDGIEFFGGSVNVNHAIVAYQGDDGIDIDQNYSGTVNNFVVKHGNGDTDEALEIDGPETATYTDGKFTLKNGTVINDGTDGSGGDLKSKAQGTIDNVNFSGYPNGPILKLRASYDPANDCAPKADGYSNYIDGDLTVTNCGFEDLNSLTDALTAYKDDDDAPCHTRADVLPNEAGVDMKTMTDGNTTSKVTGADLTEFSAWSWASANGEI